LCPLNPKAENPSPPFDKLKPMGEFPTRKHSDELIAAIVLASKRLTNAEIARKLNAGTLPQWEGTYEIPYATVSYFVRKAKAEERAGAHALHERANGDMHAALDGFGREIASELFEKLKHERSRKNPDIKKLAELATVAAKVKPLIKDTPAKPVAAPKAKDAFAAKLEASARAKPRKPKESRGTVDITRDGQTIGQGTAERNDAGYPVADTVQPVPPSPAWLRTSEA
jgi:hypothetical protein